MKSLFNFFKPSQPTETTTTEVFCAHDGKFFSSEKKMQDHNDLFDRIMNHEDSQIYTINAIPYEKGESVDASYFAMEVGDEKGTIVFINNQGDYPVVSSRTEPDNAASLTVSQQDLRGYYDEDLVWELHGGSEIIHYVRNYETASLDQVVEDFYSLYSYLSERNGVPKE